MKNVFKAENHDVSVLIDVEAPEYVSQEHLARLAELFYVLCRGKGVDPRALLDHRASEAEATELERLKRARGFVI